MAKIELAVDEKKKKVKDKIDTVPGSLRDLLNLDLQKKEDQETALTMIVNELADLMDGLKNTTFS